MGLGFDGVRLFGGQHGFWAGKTRVGESIAQRSRRSQRGNLRSDGATLLVDSIASGRERPASGKASHRGHGGHRGGILRLDGATLLVTDWFLGGKDPHRGEPHGNHRKEELM